MDTRFNYKLHEQQKPKIMIITLPFMAKIKSQIKSLVAPVELVEATPYQFERDRPIENFNEVFSNAKSNCQMQFKNKIGKDLTNE